MTEIRVTYAFNDINERKVGTRLQMQFLGVKGRLLILAALIAPFVVIAPLLHWFTGLNMLHNEVFAAILLFEVGIFCWMFATSRLGKMIDRHVAAAPHRQRDVTWVLTAEGAQGDGPPYPWAHIIDVQHIAQQTILVLSLRQVIVLPDAALPDGTTPQALQTQIAKWRA